MAPSSRIAAHQATFWGLVACRAAVAPNSPLLADNLGRSLTADGYRAAAEAAAAGLAARGVGPGTVVTWQLPTSIEAAVLLAALARLGAVQNPVFPGLRMRELDFVVNQVGTDLLVVPSVWRGFDHYAMAARLASSASCEVLVVDHRTAAARGRIGLPAGDPAALPPPILPTGQSRWVYYTSGRTAEPKGVRHTDASILAGANGTLAGLAPTSDDLFLISFPVTHVGGVVTLTTQLLTGMRLLVVDGFDPASSPAVAAAHEATILGSTPPFLNACLDAQRTYFDRRLFPGLRACVVGGTVKPPGLHAALRDELGGAGLVSMWSLTECPLATHGRLSDPDDYLDGTEGAPSPGVEVRAVDGDGRTCAPGVEGELCVRGPQLFAGYVDPDLDAGAFDRDRFFRTGDLGVVGPSGHVRITGKAMVRRRSRPSSKPRLTWMRSLGQVR